MKKHYPLAISIVSLIACIISLISTFMLQSKLKTAESEVAALKLHKDETLLTEQVEVLTQQNTELRERLYILENVSKIDEVADTIEEDIQTVIKLHIDRKYNSLTRDEVTKKAYDALREYCTTTEAFEQLVPKAVYDSIGKMPVDKDHIVETNQWADTFHIWSKLTEPGIAEVFVFYKYNNLPPGGYVVQSNYAFYVTMVYDVPSDTWKVDQVHYNELIQSKFDWSE